MWRYGTWVCESMTGGCGGMMIREIWFKGRGTSSLQTMGTVWEMLVWEGVSKICLCCRHDDSPDGLVCVSA